MGSWAFTMYDRDTSRFSFLIPFRWFLSLGFLQRTWCRPLPIGFNDMIPTYLLVFPWFMPIRLRER
jgi:hypothetical protein